MYLAQYSMNHHTLVRKVRENAKELTSIVFAPIQLFRSERDAHVMALCQALVHNTIVESLHFSSMEVGTRGVRALGEMLCHNTTITKLGFSKIRWGAENAMASIISILMEEEQQQKAMGGFVVIGLEEIEFTQTLLSRADIKALCRLITEGYCKDITRLVLSGCGLQKEDAYELANAFKKAASTTTKLVHLDLSHNLDLGDAGVIAVVESLSKREIRMETISLQHVGMTDQSLSCIQEFINKTQLPSSLLVLGGNRFSQHGKTLAYRLEALVQIHPLLHVLRVDPASVLCSFRNDNDDGVPSSHVYVLFNEYPNYFF